MSDQQHLDAAHARIAPHLGALVGRHLPDADADHMAHLLLHGAPDDPQRQAAIEALDQAITTAGKGNMQGISPSERQALGGSESVPDYLLGPGDQKTYAALRDSNLLNAALGRQPVPAATHLARGMNYALDDDGNAKPSQNAGVWGVETSDTWRRGDTLNRATEQHLQALADPTRHSSITGSAFPQHSIGGGGWKAGSSNLSTSMGDSWLGQALGLFSGWSDGSRRAARRTDGNWATNLPGEIGKGLDHEWAKQNVGRASPQVADGLSPEERGNYIDTLQNSIEPSKAPTIEQYGAAHGKTYSPAYSWLADSLHEIVDPTVPVTAGFSGAGALLKSAGKGVLKSLITAPAKAIAGEVGGELVSPVNWATLAPTFPMSAGTKMFTAPSLESLPDGMGEKGYADTYQKNQETSDRMIRDIRTMRGMLSPTSPSNQPR